MTDKKKPLLNKQNVRELLLTGKATNISTEAIAWVEDVLRKVCEDLARSGRVTERGRLMGPKMNAELMARHVTKGSPPAQPAPETGTWGPREDWQTAIREGKTRLPFEEWKAEQEQQK